MYHQSILKNGIRFVTVPMKDTAAAIVLVSVRVGSRYEPEKVIGGSHFIEHLMFKGTKRRPKAALISGILDAYGADFNAYTSKDHTAYYVKIVGDKLAVGIDLLYDMLFNSLYEPAEIKREKKVIIEEINMYEDNPRMIVGDLLEHALFRGTTLGRKIAGSRADIEAMKRADLISYRDQYYIPERLIVTLAGNFSAEARTLAEKMFSRLVNRKRQDAAAPTAVLADNSVRVERQQKPTEQVQINLGWKAYRYGAKELPALRVLAAILGGGMSSRLFLAVRERRGLAYSIHASASSYEDTGVFDISAGLDKSRLGLAAEVIMEELAAIVKRGPKTTELKRAKDFIAGKTLLHLEDCAERAEWYAKQIMFTPKEVLTPETAIKKIRAVTASEVIEIAREVLDPKAMSIGVVGPFASDQEVIAPFLK